MDRGIVEAAYHLTQEYDKPSGKKRPANLCPSYIADMEKDLSSVFERKKVYVPEHRLDNTLIGLKNLGATCYMNALLQALYCDTTFRQAVYNWRGEDEICRQLQIVFAGLQNLNRTVFDTRPFTNAMGVLASIQQDAQEFFKFLMSHVEEVFKNSEPFETTLPVPSKNFVSHQYEGSCENHMKCSTCKTSSGRESNFLEILINLTDDKSDILQNSIKEYIGVDLLREDNKYNCGKCKSKQDAECSIEITKLPQVLNFQVVRFDYDIQQNRRKKKNTTLYFPVELDMTPFMKGKAKKQLKRRKTLSDCDNAYEDDGFISENVEIDNEQNIYELTAYLIHKGVNAESGHYIAHVKDANTGNWFLFNDEIVKPLEINEKVYVKNKAEVDKEMTPKEAEKPVRESQRKPRQRRLEEVINLESEEDEDDRRSKKKGVEKKLDTLEITPEGFFKCDSCYFLCYTKKNIQIVENPSPPDHIQEVIIQQNAEFKTEYRKAKAEEAILLKAREGHENNFKKFWKGATVNGGVDVPCFWLQSKWLRKWVEGEFDFPVQEVDPSITIVSGPPVISKAMDNGPITCEHGKLSFANIDLMKRVSSDLGKFLSEKYGEPDKVLNEKSYCETCCALHAKKETGFAELLDIRNQFIETHEEYVKSFNIEGMTPPEIRKGFYIAKKWITAYKNMKTPAHFEKLDQLINSSVICEVHEFMLKTTSRQQVVIISKNQWNILKDQFPNAIEFSSDSEACPCFGNVDRKEQREKFIILTSTKCEKPPPPGKVYHFIPLSFFYEWQQYTQATREKTPRPAQKISKDSLLCKHGLLSFDPHYFWADPVNIENTVFRVADDTTYSAICKYYDVDPRHVTTDMNTCAECVQLAREALEVDDTLFEHTTFKINYKKKLTVQRKVPKRNTKNSTGFDSSAGDVSYSDESCEVHDVNFHDTVYFLKLKMQQELDYAPNRLKVAQGDTLLDHNEKTLGDYGVRKSLPLRLTILDVPDDDEFYCFSSNGKENMTGVGFSNTKLGGKSNLKQGSESMPVSIKDSSSKVITMDDDDDFEVLPSSSSTSQQMKNNSQNNNNNNNNNNKKFDGKVSPEIIDIIYSKKLDLIEEIMENDSSHKNRNKSNNNNNSNNNSNNKNNNKNNKTNADNGNTVLNYKNETLSSSKEDDKWVCANCSFSNPSLYLQCGGCSINKPSYLDNNSDLGFHNSTIDYNERGLSNRSLRSKQDEKKALEMFIDDSPLTYDVDSEDLPYSSRSQKKNLDDKLNYRINRNSPIKKLNTKNNNNNNINNRNKNKNSGRDVHLVNSSEDDKSISDDEVYDIDDYHYVQPYSNHEKRTQKFSNSKQKRNNEESDEEYSAQTTKKKSKR